jgi:hypothetical protein
MPERKPLGGIAQRVGASLIVTACVLMAIGIATATYWPKLVAALLWLAVLVSALVVSHRSAERGWLGPDDQGRPGRWPGWFFWPTLALGALVVIGAVVDGRLWSGGVIGAATVTYLVLDRWLLRRERHAVGSGRL